MLPNRTDCHKIAKKLGIPIGPSHGILNEIFFLVWWSKSRRKIEWTFTCNCLNKSTTRPSKGSSSKKKGQFWSNDKVNVFFYFNGVCLMVKQSLRKVWSDNSWFVHLQWQLPCQLISFVPQISWLLSPGFPTPQIWHSAVFSYQVKIKSNIREHTLFWVKMWTSSTKGLHHQLLWINFNCLSQHHVRYQNI